MMPAQPADYRDGATRIAQERARQIKVEGYTPDHDAGHRNAALAWAAVCYAAPLDIHMVSKEAHRDRDGVLVENLRWWEPWPRNWPRPPLMRGKAWTPEHKKARIRELEKAGALIAAEIDRLLADEGES